MSYLFTEIGSWMAGIESSSQIEVAMGVGGDDLKRISKTSRLRLPSQAPQLGSLLLAPRRAVEGGFHYRWSGSWYNSGVKLENDVLKREDRAEHFGHSETEQAGIGRIENGPIPKAIHGEHRVLQSGAVERSEDIHVQVDGHKLRRPKGEMHMLQRWLRQSATEAVWQPGRFGPVSEQTGK